MTGESGRPESPILPSATEAESSVPSVNSAPASVSLAYISAQAGPITRPLLG